jgi:hypothetical protein
MQEYVTTRAVKWPFLKVQNDIKGRERCFKQQINKNKYEQLYWKNLPFLSFHWTSFNP